MLYGLTLHMRLKPCWVDGRGHREKSAGRGKMSLQ